MQQSDIRKKSVLKFSPVDIPSDILDKKYDALDTLHDFNILSIDPGKSTGLCFWNHKSETLVDYTVEFPKDYVYIPDFIMWSPTIVIIEKPYMSMVANPILYEAFGYWKFHFTIFRIPVIYQGPNCKEAIFKRHNITRKAFSSTHAMEAYCHALYFLDKQRYSKIQKETFIRFSKRTFDDNSPSEPENDVEGVS